MKFEVRHYATWKILFVNFLITLFLACSLYCWLLFSFSDEKSLPFLTLMFISSIVSFLSIGYYWDLIKLTAEKIKLEFKPTEITIDFQNHSINLPYHKINKLEYDSSDRVYLNGLYDHLVIDIPEKINKTLFIKYDEDTSEKLIYLESIIDYLSPKISNQTVAKIALNKDILTTLNNSTSSKPTQECNQYVFILSNCILILIAVIIAASNYNNGNFLICITSTLSLIVLVFISYRIRLKFKLIYALISYTFLILAFYLAIKQNMNGLYIYLLFPSILQFNEIVKKVKPVK